MEIIIPAAALASLYFINKNDTSRTEAFTLPNTDIPDRNYPPEYNSVSKELDQTSKLSQQNKTNVNQVYTDKYFNKTSASALASDSSVYESLSGQSVTSDYFQHNNMAPFFGSKIRTNHTSDHANESILDSYSGTGSQITTKKESVPLFAPKNNTQWAFGMPNTSDFVQSRVVPTQRHANVKPFEEIKVAPGIGLGYTSEGAGGFNSGAQGRELWQDYTVDELRTANKPKASGIGLLGHEGPATHFVQYRGEQGIQEKHGPPTSFENTPDRLLQTTGLNKKESMIPVHVLRDVARPDTTTSYQGGAGYSNNGDYITGEYRQPHGVELGPTQFNPASAAGKGAGTDPTKAALIRNNNRTVDSQQGDYFGSVRGYVNEAIAPIMDILQPTRKENAIGHIRPYQNPKSAVPHQSIYNPQRAKTTIRQTTDQSQWITTGAPQVANPYYENSHQPADNARKSTGDFYYTGTAQSNAKQSRQYDGEYAIVNDGQKEKTMDTQYTPSGNTRLFNSNFNMETTDAKESLYKNSRDGVPTFPNVHSHIENLGISTIGNNQLYTNQNLDRMQDTNVQAQLKDNPFFNKSLSGGI